MDSKDQSKTENIKERTVAMLPKMPNEEYAFETKIEDYRLAVVRGGTFGSVTARTATGVFSVSTEGRGGVTLGGVASEITTLHKAAYKIGTKQIDRLRSQNQSN